jgi:hypothetical protein
VPHHFTFSLYELIANLDLESCLHIDVPFVAFTKKAEQIEHDFLSIFLWFVGKCESGFEWDFVVFAVMLMGFEITVVRNTSQATFIYCMPCFIHFLFTLSLWLFIPDKKKCIE